MSDFDELMAVLDLRDKKATTCSPEPIPARSTADFRRTDDGAVVRGGQPHSYPRPAAQRAVGTLHQWWRTSTKTWSFRWFACATSAASPTAVST